MWRLPRLRIRELTRSSSGLWAASLRSVAGGGVALALMNALLVRNPSLVKFLDWRALALPCYHPGEATVGLTLVARGGRDALLLEIRASIEAGLAASATRS